MRPLLLFVFAFFSLALVGQVNQEPVLKSVDEMPLWPGCSDRTCSDQKMLEYIYSNVTYPKAAKEAGKEGMVVVSFVVYTDGTLSQLELKRDPGHELGVEGMRVATKMSKEITGWTPGQQDGQAVNTQFYLPIRFDLGAKPSQEEGASAIPSEEVPENGIYNEVDQMPLWPNTTEGMASSEKLLEYVYTNIVYPKTAKKAGKEGMVVITFVVNTDGTLSDYSIRRDPGDGLGEEGLRLVTQMGQEIKNWTPGMKDGEAVRTYFNLPIKFKLDTKK